MVIIMDISPAAQFETASEILAELKYLASLLPAAELANILEAFSQNGACATRARRSELDAEFGRLRELSLGHTGNPGPRPDRASVAIRLRVIDELLNRAQAEEVRSARARLIATRAHVDEARRTSQTLLAEASRGEFRRPKASLLSLEGDRASARAEAASPTPATGGPSGTTVATLVLGLVALALWGLSSCGGPAR